ncbi:MAG: ABC transporter permease subunit [Gemmatimonadetes bacterium]|nr:ABC transporter permease subunit [Gemmatimonadota bacterium]
MRPIDAPPTGQAPGARTSASRRRGGSTLSIGAAMFVTLLLFNVWGALMGEVPSREALRYAPPAPRLLRGLLWDNPTRDTVESDGAGLFDLTPGDSVVRAFRSMPEVRATRGSAYSYQPVTEAALREFVLSGQPPGLSVDPVSGVVSGNPTELGRFDVVLEGRLPDDRRAMQIFPLFVDDRVLLLGADRRGRDIFLLLVRSARLTLLPGFVALVIGVGVGVVVGALGGFYGGATRRLLGGFSLVVQSVPGLLLVFLTVAASGFNLWLAMTVVGLTLLPETAGGVLERVESLKRRDFVEAARELGMRDRTILWNEIVWHNARTFVVGRVMQCLAYAVLVEVTLSYMGLAAPNAESLGEMLKGGREALIGQSSNVEAVASLFVLLFLVTTFSLLERGIVRAWDRRR